MTCNIVGNVKILNNTNQYCPKLANNARYCPMLPNICKYCPILSCIGQYCSSDYFSSFLAELWHSHIVQYCQIYPNIVRHWLISSSIDQYCLVTSYLDLFLLKLTSATSIWFRCSKELAICKYESIQVCMYANMQVCK